MSKEVRMLNEISKALGGAEHVQRKDILEEIAGLSDSLGPEQHILPPSQVDPETGLPTVEDPEEGAFYLVPSGEDEPNLYNEYIWTGDGWELFGSGGAALKNMVDGSAEGSVRGVKTAAEDENYTIGSGAFAEGNNTKASGENSHAEGGSTTASGSQSHSEGQGSNEAIQYSQLGSGSDAIVPGAKTTCSHVEGYQTTTNNGTVAVHAEGYKTIAGMIGSGGQPGDHAEGYQTYASGGASHAEGGGTTASGAQSHAEGNNTTASGVQSHAEGGGTTASGSQSHAEGGGTTASGAQSHAEGGGTTASGSQSHAEGSGTTASGSQSHSEGAGTTASGDVSHAEGNSTTASGTNSHAEGCKASTNNIIYTGETTALASSVAAGPCSHIEGQDTRTETTAPNSHAEGFRTYAKNSNAHAEGYRSTASGAGAHAEGNDTKASSSGSHAEGDSTVASGVDSHAEGFGTSASGVRSHAEGYYTIANHKSQHVYGEFNVADPSTAEATERGNYAEIVGNGTADNSRSNARTLDWSGNERLAGKLTVGAGPTEDMDVATKQYVDENAGGGGYSLPVLTITAHPGMTTTYDIDWTFEQLSDYQKSISPYLNSFVCIVRYTGMANQLVIGQVYKRGSDSFDIYTFGGPSSSIYFPISYEQKYSCITIDSSNNVVVIDSNRRAKTITLGASDWVSNTQTVSVQGVTDSEKIVLVTPAPASVKDWDAAYVICTGQNIDSLTFTCDTVPTNDITVNVVIL